MNLRKKMIMAILLVAVFLILSAGSCGGGGGETTVYPKLTITGVYQLTDQNTVSSASVTGLTAGKKYAVGIALNPGTQAVKYNQVQVKLSFSSPSVLEFSNTKAGLMLCNTSIINSNWHTSAAYANGTVSAACILNQENTFTNASASANSGSNTFFYIIFTAKSAGSCTISISGSPNSYIKYAESAANRNASVSNLSIEGNLSITIAN